MWWSYPAPRRAKRSPPRDVPVPEALPEGPSPTFPNGPVATPARRRFHGGAPRPATSPAGAVAMLRYRPPSLAVQSSSPAGADILPQGADLQRNGLLIVGGNAGI